VSLNFVKENHLTDAVGGMEECLFDQNILINFQAAQTISDFLLKFPKCCEVVKNEVPLILTSLMEISTQFNGQVLIESLTKFFTALSDSIAPHAVQISVHLAKQYKIISTKE
jgi:hypothetical protein